MKVDRNSGPGGAADIHADIESLGIEGSLKPSNGSRHQLVDFEQFVIGHARHLVRLSIGRDHKMPTRIRKSVEHHEASLASKENEILPVVVFGRKIDKDIP